MSIIKLNNNLVKLGGKLVTLSATPVETVTDYDGNIYDVVTIGTQEWTVQNLKVTHYNDGTPIPKISNYDDWFLPSKDELYQMWNQLYTWGFGNFQTNYYWCSSEDDSMFAWIQNFANGNQVSSEKWGANCVRACRSFTGGTYNLRDVGPAGGWIFITGTTYYEAAPTDQSTDSVWSNLDTTLLGTTGTAIGTGQANTTAIIGQVGHTDSAAKLTNDLTSDTLWSQDLYGAMCYYNSDILNKPIYGAMYNWYAVNTGYLAPAGWRVPSKTDYDTLITYLGGDLVAGGILKEVGFDHWFSPNEGATDTYGFKVLGAGIRAVTGAFTGALKQDSGLWDTTAYITFFTNTDATAQQVNGSSLKAAGLSVRLIKN